MTHETEADVDQRRERSPSFPYLELSNAIDLAKKLHGAAKLSEVRVTDVASIWGTTPTSGSLMRYAAALQAYGLIESSGSGLNRRIKVSDAAKRILNDERPGVRERLLAEAALKPKIMAELFELWSTDRPEDSFARSQLQFDYRFTGDAARRCLVVYDANLHYLRPSELKDNSMAEGESVSASATDVSDHHVLASTLNMPKGGSDMSDLVGHAASEMRRDVFTLDEGEVVLVTPRSISEESFLDFVDWLELIKRKIQRSVSKS
ncbi:hypothetical protein [Rhizobium sp. RU36D]|uniref:hypothetical protein n=1 Tax=Rhizobium sp. RU36D TaxID=1907415 RepID=UPI0009D7F7CE|nr:hypothetical protein [Rhizobium sp. RU36D]SMD09668.1 hypothetical protein SAMN05880593_12110 [Rhizobium sp. RU36D]